MLGLPSNKRQPPWDIWPPSPTLQLGVFTLDSTIRSFEWKGGVGGATAAVAAVALGFSMGGDSMWYITERQRMMVWGGPNHRNKTQSI